MPLFRNVKSFDEEIKRFTADDRLTSPVRKWRPKQNSTGKKTKKEIHMKKSVILKITITCLILFGFSLSGSLTLWGEEQQVKVFLKDGSSVTFEYKTFMEGNFKFPEKLNRPAREGETKYFGEKRFIMTLQQNCRTESISLDNLVEIEVLGQEINNCTGEKDWLLKVYLFDLEKYTGFLTTSAHNLDRIASERSVKGIPFDNGIERSLMFKDIKKIVFIAR
jgi:hypothetical protein